MPEFITGQRWVSDSEPELGLGIISAVEGRRISVDFLQDGQQRLYAADNAPLTRITFEPGDEVHDRDGHAYRVVESMDNEGLLIYLVRPMSGAPAGEAGPADELPLPETRLSDSIALHEPLQRLLSGQVDSPHWYRLRRRSLDTLNFLERSPLLGLCSARTDLIPHQLYIADEVASRYAPRVLLADEVGLGKTIEAGLILQQQLFTGRAGRVLIMVPDALLHQWLVEMLRRFNLRFSLFDEERCAAIEAQAPGDTDNNPFHAEQLVLCGTGFLLAHPERQVQALAADWDLLIVDEAHHLTPPADDQDETDGARAYRLVEAFSDSVKGLVLVTATPDQAGLESQFGLLRLLDPARFHDLETYRREETTFGRVADLVERLETLDSGKQVLPEEVAASLRELLRDDALEPLLTTLEDPRQDAAARRDAQHRLIAAILDRHGTGRVLFRNTRRSVSGFPPRVLHACPQDMPDQYREQAHEPFPETAFAEDEWPAFDPRVDFLLDLLERLPDRDEEDTGTPAADTAQTPVRSDKVLVICHHKQTAVALEAHLRLRRGLRSALFHEDMSILERDRAAAWFAEPDGARVLICSEIGSEGRNFQFSHHLVLFDLPDNPDQLEQRIGRLDRIGQRHDVDIHVPWLRGGAQETLFRWYQDGLDAFERINPVAFRVYRELEQDLAAALAPGSDGVDALAARARELSEEYQREYAAGRDRLVELNSHDAARSQELLDEIHRLEAGGSPEHYMQELFDSFGLDAEHDSETVLSIRPSEQMLVSWFPGLPDEGMRATFDRATAVHREDLQFLGWQHPMVRESIDLVLQGHHGKAALGVVRDRRLKPGSVLLESLYKINLTAPAELQLSRFLPCTVIRVLADSEGRDLGGRISAEDLDGLMEDVDWRSLLSQLSERRGTVAQLNEASETLARDRLPPIIQRSAKGMLTTLSDELKRLVALQQVNPSVRDSEIDFLKRQVRGLHQAMESSSLQLEAVRVLFVE